MRILINDNNEIVGYSTVGQLKGDIEVSTVPEGFKENFKPKRYVYRNNEIVYNDIFEEESEFVPDYPQIEPTPPKESVNEQMFKTMIATLQKQSVQSNINVLKVQRENQELRKRLEDLEDKSEVDNNVESNE